MAQYYTTLGVAGIGPDDVYLGNGVSELIVMAMQALLNNGDEVLIPTPGVRNLIREGKTHQIYSLIQTGGAHGMQTMDSSLAQLVREGKLTMAVAESRSSHPAELRRLVSGEAPTPTVVAA